MLTFAVLVIGIVNLVLMVGPLTPYDEARLRVLPLGC
jgi:hypothetical protein